MVNPSETALGTIISLNKKTDDLALTFIILMTAALICGKLLGLSLWKMHWKMRKIDEPSTIIFNKLKENIDARN